jgi:hypothetical protein
VNFDITEFLEFRMFIPNTSSMHLGDPVIGPSTRKSNTKSIVKTKTYSFKFSIRHNSIYVIIIYLIN